MALDAVKNFAKVTVSTGYDASALTVVLTTGHGARLAAAPFNLTWWNSTDYGDPSDDPSVEIVRCTAVVSDTLTIVRAQESTSASVKNLAGKTYKMLAGLTAKVFTTDLAAVFQPLGSYVTLTGVETLTNKTLTTPAIGSFVNAGHSHLNAAGGGTLTAAAISDLATAAVDFSNKTGNISQWTNDSGYVSDVSGYVPVTRTVNGHALSSNVSVSASDLSLGNVENTALSTWAGSTNLTTLGTIGTGTWGATAIAANKGGTGQTGYTTGDLLQASGASALSALAAVATGNALISGGVGTVGAWGKIGLTAHVSGILPGANGGTGIAYFTAAGPTTARTYTFPDASSTMATLAGAESLTNKKLGSLTTNGFVKTSGLDGTLSVDTATYLTSVTAHNLLSATHGDTTAASVARGAIITGQGASAAWALLAKPSVLSDLSHDGTDVSWATANGTGNSARTTNVVLVTPTLGAATATSVIASSYLGIGAVRLQTSGVIGSSLAVLASDFSTYRGLVAVHLALGADESSSTFVHLWPDATNVIAQRNGLLAQKSRTYNTFTTAETAGEWFDIDWQTTANLCILSTRKGSSTGTLRGMQVGASSLVPIGFYGATPITRAVLATGSAHTVDDVITALQNIGLVSQS